MSEQQFAIRMVCCLGTIVILIVSIAIMHTVNKNKALVELGVP
tara:strand:- start:1737 stop:1865 length:129 start_codon:yes stop_codon:yes gene_type:complete